MSMAAEEGKLPIPQPDRTRVLFLIHSLVAHGAERQLCELVRCLDRDRFDVHVVVFYPPGPGKGDGLWPEMAALPDTGLHCLYKFPGPLGYLTALPKLLTLIHRLQPDVLHGYMDANLPTLLLGRLLRSRVVWGIRQTSGDPEKLDRLSHFLLRVTVRLARFTDLVIFNSEAGLQSHRALGLRAPNMEVVMNGFDVSRFRPDASLGLAQRAAWGIPAEVPLIGIVGRLDPVKDHPTFLRAAARLARQWPSVRFLCVGGGPAAYRSTLEALTDSLGLLGKVHFQGACGDMPAVYNTLSALVLSSTAEGFPNVLGEAMACGIPCVTTRVGDAQTLVGPWGIVVEPGDDQRLAEGLDLLLGESPEHRQYRAQAARKRVCGSFSVHALARNTEELLLRLMAEPAVAPSKIG